jgi:hypothetical protein
MYTSIEKGVSLTFIGVGLFVILFDFLCEKFDKDHSYMKSNETSDQATISHFDKQNNRLIFE